MSSVITVKDMCLWYGQVQALKNININIEEKSITALIGPSGCGKSTFLKSLNRMNDLVPGVKITGDLRYRGEDIFDPKLNVNELRRNIGMVFQKPNPFPMSIYDNIAYGPRTHGITSRAKLDEIVENSLKGAAIWNEVKDNLKKSALSLSGGQQQRVAIARALVSDAPIILADEPTGNLDSVTAGEIINILKTLAKERNKCVIVVTHSKEAADSADIILELSGKKLKKVNKMNLEVE